MQDILVNVYVLKQSILPLVKGHDGFQKNYIHKTPKKLVMFK